MNQDQQRQAFEDYSFEIAGQLFEQSEGQFETLSEEEQEIVRIWRLEADMCGGGFIQYFCNWGYENYLQTIPILLRLQAIESLSIITRCEGIIARLEEDDRFNDLWDIPKYLTQDEKAQLSQLDELYQEDRDDLQLLCFLHYMA